MRKPVVVTGVIGIEDPHVIGHKIIVRALQEEGFKVMALGAKCAPQEFIDAAIEGKAVAILISSVAGQGELHCRGFRDKCTEAGLKDIILYAGGNLVVGKLDWDYVEKTFLEMGFDRVYKPGTYPEAFIADLKKDLKIKDSDDV